jgi:hypothetical protein
MVTLLAITLTGCAVGQPMAPTAQVETSFETKLINFQSIGSQFANQTNYTPNSQGNSAMQSLFGNTSVFGAVASLAGTGGAAGANAVGQALTNNLAQPQTQSNLIL